MNLNVEALLLQVTSLSAEIHRRLPVANRSSLGLIKVPKFHCTIISTKIKQYTTFIWPVELCGCEMWAINKTMKIISEYLKVLKNGYGQIKVNGEGRYRCNHELYQIYKEHEIIQESKATRDVWLEHLLTAYQLYPCRKLTFTNPCVTRNVGQLLVRWMDDVEEDLNRSGFNLLKPDIFFNFSTLCL